MRLLLVLTLCVSCGGKQQPASSGPPDETAPETTSAVTSYPVCDEDCAANATPEDRDTCLQDCARGLESDCAMDCEGAEGAAYDACFSDCVNAMGDPCECKAQFAHDEDALNGCLEACVGE